MEKGLQELFWVPIPIKRYQNISRCDTDTYMHTYIQTYITVSSRVSPPPCLKEKKNPPKLFPPLGPQDLDSSPTPQVKFF